MENHMDDDPTRVCPNPSCKKSLDDGQYKVLGRPFHLRDKLNEIWQCVNCRYLFSPKDI